MRSSPVPRFIPLKQTTGFFVVFFHELICAFEGCSCRCSGLLRRKTCCDLLDMFLLIVGASKEFSWDNSVIITGNPGLENIVLALQRLIAASGTCRVEITCPGGVELCFWFVLEEKAHTRTGNWTLIKYCLCYLLFLPNTSNWWDLLKTWTLGQE